MKRIVLIRHGESQWNKENRFTGWTNVDLSEKGVQEALDAGNALKEAGITFEVAYTSYLKSKHYPAGSILLQVKNQVGSSFDKESEPYGSSKLQLEENPLDRKSVV